MKSSSKQLGLGETVVSGVVNPDDYVVDKATLQIKNAAFPAKPSSTSATPKQGKPFTWTFPKLSRNLFA